MWGIIISYVREMLPCCSGMRCGIILEGARSKFQTGCRQKIMSRWTWLLVFKCGGSAEDVGRDHCRFWSRRGWGPHRGLIYQILACHFLMRQQNKNYQRTISSTQYLYFSSYNDLTHSSLGGGQGNDSVLHAKCPTTK